MINLFRNFFTMTIKRQLIFGIAFVHAVMMSFFVYDLVSKERDFLIEQHDKTSKSLAKSLASSSVSWVLANDFVGLNEVVSSLEHYPGIDQIMIANTQGQILAHTKSQYIGKYLSDKKSIGFLKSDVKTKIVVEDDNFTDVISPILRDSQHIGWARIVLTKDDINNGIYNVTQDGIIYTFLAIVVGVFFAYLLSYGITSGIYQILQSIKKLKKGDSYSYSRLNRVDEIGALSKEFDNMIDAIKKSKEDLKKLNEMHELTLDGLNDGLWDWNIKTDKCYFSKNWKKMLGFEENELENVGKTFFNLVHPDDRQRVKDALDAHFKAPKVNEFSLEIRLMCKDCSYKWILTRGSVLFDDNNEPYRMLGFHSDISKEKENEIKNKKQEKLIHEQSKLASMGEMIGNIAHQWRQPLSIISTGATGLKLKKEMGVLDDKDFFNTCDTINDNVQYLSNTIDDFKNFIKGDRKKEKFNLKENINSFIHFIEGSAKDNQIKIVLNIDDGIVIDGYPNELIQCFINLFNNSKDALKSISEQRYIFINVSENEKTVCISFKDNAGGIDEKVLPHIFEPYFTTKHQSQGTGLGLSIIYNLIVEGMDGTLSVDVLSYEYEGKKYKGAEFQMTLEK